MASINLLDLPGEIQNKIISSTDGASQLLLRTTCAYLRAVIPPPDVLAIETSPHAVARDAYACSKCSCLRHSSHFADKMLRKKRRRGGDDADMRFCLACGLKNSGNATGYSPGSRITIRGVSYVLCAVCRKFKEDDVLEEFRKPACETCRGFGAPWATSFSFDHDDDYEMVF